MKHKTILIFTAFILFSMVSSCSQKQGNPALSSQTNPKNVIMIIGDGMGPEQVGLLLTLCQAGPPFGVG